MNAILNWDETKGGVAVLKLPNPIAATRTTGGMRQMRGKMKEKDTKDKRKEPKSPIKTDK